MTFSPSPWGLSINDPRVDLYVAPSNAAASDRNPGDSPELPLATLDEALTRLNQCFFIPSAFVIHLESGTHDWTVNLGPKACNAPIVILGDGAGQDGDNGFTVLSSGAAAAGTDRDSFVTAGGLTIDAFQGKTWRWTSGAASGYRRQIRDNTADTITPTIGCDNQVPAEGDTYEICEPAVVLAFRDQIPQTADLATNINGVGSGKLKNNNTGSLIGSRNRAINFVNCRFDREGSGLFAVVHFQDSTAGFWGCEFVLDGGIPDCQVSGDVDSAAFCGVDYGVGANFRAQLPVDIGILDDNDAWTGWGLFLMGASTGLVNIVGSVCGQGSIVGFGSDGCNYYICGGSFITTGEDGCFITRGNHTIGGANNEPDVLFKNDSAAGDAVCMNISSSGNVAIGTQVEMQKENGFAVVFVEMAGTGDGRAPNVQLSGELIGDAVNPPVRALAISGGLVAIEVGSLTISGTYSDLELAVYSNGNTTLVEEIAAAGFIGVGGSVLPGAATSDGRDGFIRVMN